MELRNYQDKFQELIQLEQEEEMSQYEREIKMLSGQERQNKGRCLLNMTISTSDDALRGERRVTFAKSNGDPLPELEISVGDIVQVSRDKPLDDNNPTGTVWKKTGREITLSFSGSLPPWVQGDNLRLDLYVDNVTYQRMLDALFLLPGFEQDQIPLREILLEKRNPGNPEGGETSRWFNEDLNTLQKDAVLEAVDSNRLYMIHGPPGTGKTVTLTEVIAQGVYDDRKILASAPSNVAVDNLLDNLIKQGLDVVRIGHPARTHPDLRDHTLDARLKERQAFRKSESKRREALQLIEERNTLTAPSGKWRRGLDDEEIHHLASENKGSRGLSPERIEEMSKYLNLNHQIDELFSESDRLEDRAIGRLLNEVDVICCTNTTAGSDLLAGYKFDWVCIDEATQATEPSCLIPITKGHKLIMAGDHRQLPPTVLNETAKADGLSTSLFERMMDLHRNDVSTTLSVQYRMHRDIMSFSNQMFYENQMSASSNVRDHTLKDFPCYHPESVSNQFQDVLRERPIINWVDTAEIDAPERRHEESHSLFNPVEVKVVRDLLDGLLETGLSPSRLATISPYKAQVELLRNKLQNNNSLDIDTIDGFQGREKDVVVISFVRNNESGAVGFLQDERRLNVSLTRAKRKLLLVGDRPTLTKHPIYRSLLDHVRSAGKICQLSSIRERNRDT